MRHYELVVVLSPMLSQDQASDTWGRIKDFISARSGDITHEEGWGTRRLAYPIRKGSHQFLEGSYHLTRFSIDQPINRELHTFLRVDDQVLRSLVIVAQPPGIEPETPAQRRAAAVAAAVREAVVVEAPVAEAAVAVAASVAEAGAAVEEEAPVAEAGAAVEEEAPVDQAEEAVEEEAPLAQAEAAVEEEAPVAQAEAAVEEKTPVAETEAAVEEEVRLQRIESAEGPEDAADASETGLRGDLE